MRRAALIGMVLLPLSVAAAEPTQPERSGSTDVEKVSWQLEPYFRPVFGISSFVGSEGSYTGVRLGATAGVHYWKDPLLGRTRALVAWTTGSGGLSGLDLRLGSFMGPQKKYWGADAGLDLFWDRYGVDSADLLPASAGIDIPFNLHLGPEKLYGLGGITPAVLFNPDRRVDWSRTDVFGFGHEFAWQLGFGARLGRFGVHAVYSRRVVASGVRSGVGLSVSL